MTNTTETSRTASPLIIVHEARALETRGLRAEALTLLKSIGDSAEHYPSFYVVLGECLIGLGRTAEARTALKRALHLAPNSAQPAILLESLDHSFDPVAGQAARTSAAPAKQRSSNGLTLASLFGASPSTPSRSAVAKDRVEVRPEALKRTVSASHEVPSFDLAQVASLLSRERPLVRPTSESSIPFDDAQRTSTESPLISETLAGILLGQGKLTEALSAYRQLRTINPDRKPEYDERIQVIEAKLHH